MQDRIRVMVVEDQKILRDNLMDMLSQEDDITVCASAESGIEAVRKAAECRPEIILMDVEMETSTAGIDAAQRILSDDNAMKIIFLSVHEDSQTVIEALGTGALDYVVKNSDCRNAISHIRRAHQDIIQMETAIQKILHNEYVRLSHSTKDSMEFLKRVMMLTYSEKDIVGLLLEGLNPREISEARFTEQSTVKKHITRILRKCGMARTKDLCRLIKELQVEGFFNGGK